MSFSSDAQIIIQALEDYYHETVAGRGPVIQQSPMRELIDELELAALVREGGLHGERLARFIDRYLANITRIYHPANVAHQQAVPHYMAALAGLVDHFVSSDGSIYELGPASVSIEYFLVNWLLQKVGWTPAPLPPLAGPAPALHGGGVLLDGGSLANLTALIAARSRIAPEAWQAGNPADLVLLAPTESHYSISRAAGIMGLGQQAVYALPVDRCGVIRPEALPAVLARVRAENKRPLALVANACTTAAGLYDPLHEIGTFCRQHDIWFHVDGAHGGPAVLTERYRHLMRGVELADSLSMNMHKMMRVTAFCTALLMRDARTLDQALSQDASYLFFDKQQPGYDFLHRTVECTKPVLGLKFLLVLAAMGEEGMGRYIEGRFDLAREVYRTLQALPDFECPAEPQSNILCFRPANYEGDLLALRDRLLARGDYYISTAALDGQRYLRLTLTNPATGLQHIAGLVDEIRQLIKGEEVT